MTRAGATPAMCPTCGAWQRDVLESRRRPGYVYRRCTCRNCKGRYSTVERVLTGNNQAVELALVSTRDELGDLADHLAKLQTRLETMIAFVEDRLQF